ncbi:glucan biosynthesis protein C [Sphingomonas kyeonggiensis]|uniref:acyltransferase family protein n=1 Tax=Sphingomonas kyeonggiensis TaxID=1268553 RepID=UPI0027846D3A|nr:acyltransferase family protein [Sphingomonas kyeonggiensis]MDQ0252534.1 glucan biosynthesis protein C [Sphingomonas kyeonggiensis]
MGAKLHRERIAGLDNWRALLMLAGIFLHATTVQEVDRPLFVLIAKMSSNFRMGAFFAVAGLLSLLALRKRGAEPWLARRSFQIGVPMLFGLCVLAPLMSALSSWHRFGVAMPALPELGWWHFWFLVDLLVFAPITFWFYRADQMHGLFARIDKWVETARPSVTLTILAVGVLSTASVLLVAQLARESGALAEPVWAVHQVVAYAPLYAFGVLVAGSPALFKRIIARTGPPFIVLVLVLAVCCASRLLPGGGAGLYDTPASLFNVITACMCPPAVTVLILRSAVAMRATPPLFRQIADASFTIYMVHFPIILLLDLLFDPLRLDPYLAYVLMVGLSGWLSYLVHRVIVRRSAFAAMLLNGVNPAKPRAVAAE